MVASVAGYEYVGGAGEGSNTSDPITIPASTNLIILIGNYHNSTQTLTYFRINDTPDIEFTELINLNYATNDGSGVFLFILKNPPTGAQTVDWAWPSAVEEGGELKLIYITGADVSGNGYTDYGSDGVSSNGALSTITLTSTSTDLIVANVQCYADSGGYFPYFNQTGETNFTLMWDYLKTQDEQASDVAHWESSGATATVSTGTANSRYPSVIGISIPEAASSALPLILQQM